MPSGAEFTAIDTPAFEAGGDFGIIAIGERGMESLEFVLELADGAKHFVAILLQNRAPEMSVAFGDPGRITETAAGVIPPGVVLAMEMGAEGRRDHVRQVTDMGDDFIVLIRICRDDFATEVVPEMDNGLDRGRIRFFKWGDEAGALLKKFGIGVFPSGLLGTGHGMRADEISLMFAQSGVTEASDLSFDTADVGDDSLGGKVGCDSLGKLDNAIHRGGNHDQIGTLNSGFRCFGGVVTPVLRCELQSHFGTTGPDDDAFRQTACRSRARHRGAE